MALRGREPGLLAGAALIFVLGSFLLVAADPLWFFDREAMHNATVGRAVLHGGGRWLLNMQYMPFCGGCSVLSVLAAGSFAVFGETFPAWLAVPLLFGVGVLWAGALLVHRVPGALPAWLALLALPPILLAQSMVMGWGNHFEVTALVLLLALHVEAMARGEAGTRAWLLLSFGFVATAWFSLTGAVAGLAFAVRLWPSLRASWGRGPSALLGAITLGATLGAVPFLAFLIVDGRDPLAFAREFQGGDGRWEHLGGRWSQLSLLAYAGVLDAPGDGSRNLLSVVVTAGLLAGVALGIRRWREEPMPALLLASYGLAYALSPAEPSGLGQQGLPAPVDQRYLVPYFVAGLLCVAQGLGPLLTGRGPSPRSGRLPRVGAVTLLTLLVLGSLPARLQWWGKYPAVTRVGLLDPLPFDYGMVAGSGFWHLPPGTLERWPTTDRVGFVNSRRALGQRLAFEFGETGQDDLPAFLARLRETGLEVDLLVSGMGRELRVAALDHGELAFDPALYVARIHRFAGLLSAEEAQAFQVPLWIDNAALGARLPPGLLAGCGVCPAEGAALVTLPDRVEEEMLATLIPEAALRATGAWRRDLLLGAGSSLGRALGHAPELLERLGAGLDAADRAALDRGFALGAAGRWRRPLTPQTPLELLP